MGTSVWENPQNVYAADGAITTSTPQWDAQGTDYLTVSGFGFNIPSNSIIDGIIVSPHIGGGVSGGSFSIGKVSNPIANKWENAPINEIGGVNDLWGTTFTVADINDPEFGVKFYLGKNPGQGATSIDYIQITVYYTPPPTVTITSTAGRVVWDDAANMSVDGICPGVDGWTRDRGVSLTFTFDQAVEGFTINDIQIANAGPGETLGTFSEFLGSGTTYTANFALASTLTDDYVTFTVPAGAATAVATGIQNAAYHNEGVMGGDSYGIAFQETFSTVAQNCTSTYADLYLPFDVSAAGSNLLLPSKKYAEGYDLTPYQGQNVGATAGGCPATTAESNAGSFIFNGINNYVSVASYSPITLQTISLWVKSDTANPSDQTILQWLDELGRNFVTVRYTSSKTNFLHVATPAHSVISSAAFDITEWNHISVTVREDIDGGHTIQALKVNGSSVYTVDNGGTTMTAGNAGGDGIIIGARYDDNGDMLGFFDGYIDEVIAPVTFDAPTPGTKSTSCVVPSVPTATSFTPVDNATGISTATSLILQFDQTVVKGTGNITVKNAATNATVQTIAVTSGNVVLGTTATTNDTATISINALSASTGYYVTVDAGAFQSSTGGSFAGITDATTWNFTTGDGVGEGTLFRITGLPTTIAASYGIRRISDSMDAYATGLASGTHTVRLTQDSVPVVDTAVGLTQNRTWSTISAQTDTQNHKVVVKFLGDNTGASGTHTIYATKGSTTSFRVCPNAQALSDVTSGCTGGVLFSGTFPASQTVGSDTVEVGTVNIGGTLYWYASGLTGSGGEGEGGAGDPVPFFPWWSVPVVGLIGWYVLKRGQWLEA